MDFLFVECDTKECDEGNFTVKSALCKDKWSHTVSFDSGAYDDQTTPGSVTLFTYDGDGDLKVKVEDVTLHPMH